MLSEPKVRSTVSHLRNARSAFKRRRATIERVAGARLPTESGDFRIIGYRSLISKEEFVVLLRGVPATDAARDYLRIKKERMGHVLELV